MKFLFLIPARGGSKGIPWKEYQGTGRQTIDLLQP